MRKNMENLYGFAQATYKEVLDLKCQITSISSKLDSVSVQVQRATFNTVLNGCDISDFFPVETNQQLEAFMDREHPQWESRKLEFYHFLYTTASKTKRGFAKGLINALFKRTYISEVKWPSSG